VLVKSRTKRFKGCLVSEEQQFTNQTFDVELQCSPIKLELDCLLYYNLRNRRSDNEGPKAVRRDCRSKTMQFFGSLPGTRQSFLSTSSSFVNSRVVLRLKT
jgi:hypothetical protein